MSIIPGIETAAPERTETSSGSPGSPKRLPGLLLQARDVIGDLLLEARRQVARAHVGAAGVGRDREPGRHRQPELRHLGEPDPLAAEQLPAAIRRLVEVVDVPAHGRQIVNHGTSWAWVASPASAVWENVLGARARPARPRRPDGEPVSTASPIELPGELTDLTLLSLAARGPARARARLGRHPRLRRQHREHARRLARARLRPHPARGVGVRHRARRAGAPG